MHEDCVNAISSCTPVDRGEPQWVKPTLEVLEHLTATWIAAPCRRVRGMTWMLFCCLLLAVAGCALPVRMTGTSGPVSWAATDLSLKTVNIESSSGEEFGFTLLLQEKQGKKLLLTHVEWEVWQANVERSGPLSLRGPWTLPPHGSLRLPFAWSVYCPPATVCPDTGNLTEWEMTFFGQDADSQAVEFPMSLILPWVPP